MKLEVKPVGYKPPYKCEEISCDDVDAEDQDFSGESRRAPGRVKKFKPKRIK